MILTEQQRDRARGAVLGGAVGDALGAAYEFESRSLDPAGPAMLGGGLGNFAPGEWTDDTAMAWCILDALANVADLDSDAGRTQVARRFRDWFDSIPADIGMQTSRVLDQAGPGPTAASMRATSYDLHARTGHTGGNGSLMRTGPVALGYLEDPEGLALAAARVSALTHYDPQAQEACVLWSLAIRRAILHGELDVRTGLEHLEPGPAGRWSVLIDEAETQPPTSFTPNRWVVTAFQAAWSAISQTPTNGVEAAHLTHALATVIGIGDDTDTTAAIAGALLGARWGAATIPEEWRVIVHGYPGIAGSDLLALVDRALAAQIETPDRVTLWRPTGPEELALVEESGWKAWPPRLPDQPIFYPVLNEDYATRIARDWNVKASGVGYVTKFQVEKKFLDRYEVQRAGGETILEYWIPAEDLDELNRHVIGKIEVVAEYR